MTGLTTDPDDPNLRKKRPDGQNETYLVLSEVERAKGFVRPVRNKYIHLTCGTATTMGPALEVLRPHLLCPLWRPLPSRREWRVRLGQALRRHPARAAGQGWNMKINCDRCDADAYIHGNLPNGEPFSFCKRHYDRYWKARNRLLRWFTKRDGGPWGQRCPRRQEAPDPNAYGDGSDTPDVWEYGHGLISGDRYRIKTCSYCGSMHPDEFLAQIRDGWIVGQTSKNYKAYIGPPPSGSVAKFYFQHMDEAQKRELIQLTNDRLIAFDIGNFWYTDPYFMVRAK